MNLEPQKFFIGVIDFFSVLLPGALLTYFLMDDVGPHLLEDRYATLEGTEAWLVFLFSSYLLGDFIFLVGAILDRFDDILRDATDAGQIKRLANGKKRSLLLTRWLAAFFFMQGVHKALNRAKRIRDQYLDPLNAAPAINTFQWSKARLMLEKPEALATVQRFEADSKFFRSLVVVLSLLIPWWALAQQQPVVALGSLLLLALAFWRYLDQRAKATNQAFRLIITLEGSRDDMPRKTPYPRSDKLLHAGGVVFRQGGDEVQYLLVQAKNSPQKWVLPKGRIKAGERKRETAVREVREEAGVWARVREKLKSSEFNVGGKSITVQFYLMEALEEERPRERRKRQWMPIDKAMQQATHSETKELLTMADTRRRETLDVISDLATTTEEQKLAP